MARAEMLMHSNPDSALSVLGKIEAGQLHNRHDIALYSLLYSQALDKNYIDLTSDSTIAPAVDYYTKRENHNRKAQSLYYLGRIHYNAKEIELAAEAFLEAKEAVLKTDNHFLSGQIYNILGKLYYDQRLFTEAVDAYKHSAIFFKKANEPKRYANALSYAGKCCYLLKKDSLALEYFCAAADTYEAIGDNYNFMIVSYSIIDLQLSKKDLNSAYMQIKELQRLYNNDTIAARTYPLWSRLHYMKNDYESARNMAHKALEHSFFNTDIKAGTLLLLKNIYLAEKNYKEANHYGQEYLRVSDSLNRAKENHHLKEIEARFSKERLQQSYYELESKHSQNRLIYVVSILALIILSLCAYMFQRHRLKILNQKYLEDIRSLEMLNHHLALMHNGNTAPTSEVLAGMKSRIAYIKDLLDGAYTTNNHPEKFYKKFQECTQKHSYDNFSDLVYIANKANNGVMDYIKERYPSLTEKEIFYCSLIYLGFSTNAIRMMYGHQNETSIYNTRSKINKKMDIRHIKLESFLNQLIYEAANQKQA